MGKDATVRRRAGLQTREHVGMTAPDAGSGTTNPYLFKQAIHTWCRACCVSRYPGTERILWGFINDLA